MDKEKVKFKLIFWYSILWILLFVALYLAYGVYFLDTTSTKSKWVILFSSSIAILLSALKFLEISFYKYKDEIIKKEIKEKNKIISLILRYKDIISVIFFSLLFYTAYKYVNLKFSLCAMTGIILFIVVSKFSSKISIIGSIKAQDANKNSLNEHIKLTYNTNCAISLLYWGILSSGAVVLFHLFKDYETLIGYACGISTIIFIENIVKYIIKSSIDNTYNFIQQFETYSSKNPITDVRNIISNQNNNEFFEIYFIALICAITMGANSINLMGAFLPLILVANAIFASIITILLIKINKSNNIAKFHFKSILFIVFIVGVLSYFEVHYWLGKDFMPISYSAIIGSIYSIIVICTGKNRKYISELQKIKKNSLKIPIQILSILVFVIAVFLFAEGMNYVSFGLYCLTVAILSFNSIVLVANMINKDENLKDNSRNYLNTGSILIVFASIISFMMTESIKEVDLLNPTNILILIFGATIPLFSRFFTTSSILKLSRKLILTSKKQIKANELNLNSIARKGILNSLPVALFGFISYFALSFLVFRYVGSEAFFVFILGNIIPCMLLQDEYGILGIILRYNCAILIGMGILWR